LEHLHEDLKSKDENIDALDKLFHEVIKELFYWQEIGKLLSDMTCPIQ
jgi:hypothetical protein